ncbi:MAG: carboxypeptidase regulatory-like domain-containing protein [Kofleriaceae bacterium]
MKRKQWIVATALAAVLAAGVTWRQHGRRAAPSARPPAEQGHRHGDHGDRETPVDEPELRSGPPRILADDDPAGALRLEGQVLDGDDAPVADAVIALSSVPPRQTKSGADGSFAFDGLLAKPYTLTARAAAGAAGPVTARLTATSDPVVLRLREGATLELEVVDARQQPIEGATVELRGIETQTFTAKLGKVTASPLVPGFYQVVAWADGYARSFVPTIVGVGSTSQRVELVRGAPVAGKVVDERGAPVAEARVRYETASDFIPGSDMIRDAVVTGADGAFSFPALPAGSFRFIATHADYASGVSELTSLDGTQPRADVKIELPAGATVSGKVVTSSGEPLASARVRVGLTGAGMRIIVPPREAYSDASGAFTIRGLARRELTALALHELGASAAASVDTTAGDVRDVTLTLDATGTISGVVVDSAGEPVEGAQVSALPDLLGRRSGKRGESPGRSAFAQWQLRGFPQELSDANGQFQLTGLAPGTYRVRATRSSAVSRGRGLMSDGVEAEAGATGVRILLPAEGAIQGKVAFADGGAPKRFTVAVGFTQQAFTSGEFLLDSLSPQSYQLVVRGDAFETKVLDVKVEPGKTLDLGTITVAPGRALRGVVVASGAPVAGAKVYAGNQLMGSGASSSGRFAPMMRGVKDTVAGADGTFVLEGFGDNDLVVVAEHPEHGRSRAITLGARAPGQDHLTLELLPFGSVRGALRQGAKPLEGVMVTAQSVTSPAALYTVTSGSDGVYRFDRLAPDTYKVSAMVGMPMTGMRQYSKPVEVTSGKESVVDLAVDPGSVTLEVEVTAEGGTGLIAWALVSGSLTAATAKELRAKMAAAGAGASQLGMGRAPLRLSEVSPGKHSLCAVAYPRELDNPMRLIAYAEQYGEQLPAVCRELKVAAAPATQAASVHVVVPPLQGAQPPTEPPPGGAPPASP